VGKYDTTGVNECQRGEVEGLEGREKYKKEVIATM
jgi:hypothetical protein